MTASPSLLAVSAVSKSFRGLRAVDDVTFEVPHGAIMGLIGPNGAGKTTIFNLIAGVTAPDSGDIAFEGRSLRGLRPDRICAAGIGRTFQIVRPFPRLSVLDNVTVGAFQRHRKLDHARSSAAAILDLLGLSGAASRPAGSLTLPERKRLEVARALATEPRLLLLDEVMAGLRPTETDEMVEVVRRLNTETGITVLLIEHVMRAVMALSHDVCVMNYGKLISRGSPDVVTRDPAVLECYLGEEDWG